MSPSIFTCTSYFQNALLSSCHADIFYSQKATPPPYSCNTNPQPHPPPPPTLPPGAPYWEPVAVKQDWRLEVAGKPWWWEMTLADGKMQGWKGYFFFVLGMKDKKKRWTERKIQIIDPSPMPPNLSPTKFSIMHASRTHFYFPFHNKYITNTEYMWLKSHNYVFFLFRKWSNKLWLCFSCRAMQHHPATCCID